MKLTGSAFGIVFLIRLYLISYYNRLRVILVSFMHSQLLPFSAVIILTQLNFLNSLSIMAICNISVISIIVQRLCDGNQYNHRRFIIKIGDAVLFSSKGIASGR